MARAEDVMNSPCCQAGILVGDVTAGEAVALAAVVVEAGSSTYLLQLVGSAPLGRRLGQLRPGPSRDCCRRLRRQVLSGRGWAMLQHQSFLKLLLAVSRGGWQPRAQPCSCHACQVSILVSSENLRGRFSIYIYIYIYHMYIYIYIWSPPPRSTLAGFIPSQACFHICVH